MLRRPEAQAINRFRPRCPDCGPGPYGVIIFGLMYLQRLYKLCHQNASSHGGIYPTL